MEPKRPRNLPNVPWITPSGTLDPARFPIESVLRQTQSRGLEDFRSGCIFLGSMVSHGRIDAGVYLLGLLRYHHNDLTRLEIVIEGLRSFREDVCVTALFDELRRVKSSNATRRYLDQVIRALTSFPPDMVQARFHSLAADTSFSYRMRAKFAKAAESVESKGPRGFALEPGDPHTTK